MSLTPSKVSQIVNTISNVFQYIDNTIEIIGIRLNTKTIVVTISKPIDKSKLQIMSNLLLGHSHLFSDFVKESSNTFSLHLS